MAHLPACSASHDNASSFACVSGLCTSLPDAPPSSPSRSQVFSRGGSAEPAGPCGLKGSHPDRDRDACRRDPHVEPPSPCLELPCSNSCVLHAASGGSTKCPKSVDPCGCTAEIEDSCSLGFRGHSNTTFNLYPCHPSWRPGFISRLWNLSRLWIATTPPFQPQSLLPPPSSPTSVA